VSNATLIAGILEIEIQFLFESLYGTFDYTKTGNKRTLIGMLHGANRVESPPISS
jgi:hypothetical protein